jgi:hypothetical protein
MSFPIAVGSCAALQCAIAIRESDSDINGAFGAPSE